MSYQFDVKPDGQISLRGQIPPNLGTADMEELVSKLSDAKKRSKKAQQNYRKLIPLSDIKLEPYRKMLDYLIRYFPSLGVVDDTPLVFDHNRILVNITEPLEWPAETLLEWDAPLFDSLEYLIKTGFTVNFVHHFYKNFLTDNPDPYTVTWVEVTSKATSKSSDDPYA